MLERSALLRIVVALLLVVLVAGLSYGLGHRDGADSVETLPQQHDQILLPPTLAAYVVVRESLPPPPGLWDDDRTETSLP